ncbi:hypothetical protein EXIGLDRAFT_832811 [Exidia glandulosa HHB12029]|uniref:Uncharacterized protein n=1 Tax=Exidia glandulosa HHB12029 TaxID=1314781 RepID=A0A165L9K8_EXIGL|nr:hypothetical protein EXIGLDRAFT_832811 [Exidia glandulosa HHB12029]
MLRRTKKTETLVTTLKVSLTSLKVAREATDGIPIVQQILGSAIVILEAALQLQTGSEAVLRLAETSARIASSVHEVSKNNPTALDDPLTTSLDNLKRTFQTMESFIQEATTGGIRRLVRQFGIADKAREMEHLLNTELQAFMAAATIVANSRLRKIEDGTVKYDGEFRRLRGSDVEKSYGVLHQEIHEDETGTVIGTVTFEKAVVKRNVMILRSVRPGPVSPATATAVSKQTVIGTTDISVLYDEHLLQDLSLIRPGHPGLAIFYGSTARDSIRRFSAIQGGTIDYKGLVQSRELEFRAKTALSTAVKIRSAMDHLVANGAVWFPLGETPIMVNEAGEPVIGVFDDITEIGDLPPLGPFAYNHLQTVYFTGGTHATRPPEQATFASCFSGRLQGWIDATDKTAPAYVTLAKILGILGDFKATYAYYSLCFPIVSARSGVMNPFASVEPMEAEFNPWQRRLAAILSGCPKDNVLNVGLNMQDGGINWNCYYSHEDYEWQEAIFMQPLPDDMKGLIQFYLQANTAVEDAGILSVPLHGLQFLEQCIP